MTKKKIAIVTNSMKGGGTERFVWYLLKSLEDTYDIHLLLTESKIEYELPESQKIAYLNKDHHKVRNFTSLYEFPSFLVKIPVYSQRLIEYCKKHEIETVVSFLERANFTCCFAKLIGFKGRVLISERTHTPSFYGNSIRGKIGMNIVKRLYPLADAIIVNSDGSEFTLRENCNIKSNYYVLKNMIDLSEVKKKALEKVDETNFDNFTFVYLAGFRDGKNHRLLVEAFAELNNPATRLLLIGKGKKMESTQKLVKTLGIEDKVDFLGYTDNPYKFLAQAHCFVSSSDFEGFPNVLLEALACELPIISTDCPSGPRELLAPGTDFRNLLTDRLEKAEFGVLVPIKNKVLLTQAMKEMFEQKDLRTHYRESSFSGVKEYDVGHIVENFRDIIES